MKRLMLAGALVLFLGSASGCRKAPNDQEAIRAGIQRHLKENGSLNLAAMNVDVQQVSITGDRAQAEVQFHLKQGGAGMRVVYQLERKDGAWLVLRRQPNGGEVSHPPMDHPPVGGPTSAAENFPSALTELEKLPPASAQPTTLPPNHPPIGASATAQKQTGSTAPTPAH